MALSTTVQTVKKSIYPYVYPIRNLLSPRRIHVYCLSAPRSGTHSIDAIFSKHYRSRHEPTRSEVVVYLQEFMDGKKKESDIFQFLQSRDQQEWLEMESNNQMAFFVEFLVKAFPDAKFLLTIRDCYSWLDSLMNFCVYWSWGQFNDRGTKDEQTLYRAYDSNQSLSEQTRSDVKLQSLLSGFLGYWAATNARIISVIPKDRLLLFKTREISHSGEKIAQFLNVPLDSLDLSDPHKDKARGKYDLLLKMDRDFIEKQVTTYCKPLMETYFPEIHRLEDSVKPTLSHVDDTAYDKAALHYFIERSDFLIQRFRIERWVANSLVS